MGEQRIIAYGYGPVELCPTVTDTLKIEVYCPTIDLDIQLETTEVEIFDSLTFTAVSPQAERVEWRINQEVVSSDLTYTHQFVEFGETSVELYAFSPYSSCPVAVDSVLITPFCRSYSIAYTSLQAPPYVVGEPVTFVADYSGIDYIEWQTTGGIKFSYKNLKAYIEAGYAEYNYDDTTNTIRDIEELVVNLEGTWDLQTGSSLNFDYQRDVYEDDDVINPAVRDVINVIYKQDITDRTALSLQGTYQLMDFESINREDEKITGGINAEYSLNDHLALGASYSYITRDSDAADLDYNKNLTMLYVNGKI